MYTHITGTTESHLWTAKSKTVSRGFTAYSSRVVRSLVGNTEANEIASARCREVVVTMPRCMGRTASVYVK